MRERRKNEKVKQTYKEQPNGMLKIQKIKKKTRNGKGKLKENSK